MSNAHAIVYFLEKKCNDHANMNSLHDPSAILIQLATGHKPGLKLIYLQLFLVPVDNAGNFLPGIETMHPA